MCICMCSLCSLHFQQRVCYEYLISMYHKNVWQWKLWHISWASYQPNCEAISLLQSLESFFHLSHLLAYNIETEGNAHITSIMMSHDYHNLTACQNLSNYRPLSEHLTLFVFFFSTQLQKQCLTQFSPENYSIFLDSYLI